MSSEKPSESSPETGGASDHRTPLQQAMALMWASRTSEFDSMMRQRYVSIRSLIPRTGDDGDIQKSDSAIRFESGAGESGTPAVKLVMLAARVRVKRASLRTPTTLRERLRRWLRRLVGRPHVSAGLGTKQIQRAIDGVDSLVLRDLIPEIGHGNKIESNLRKTLWSTVDNATSRASLPPRIT